MGVVLIWFCFNAGTGSASKHWASLMILWGSLTILSNYKFSLSSSLWFYSPHARVIELLFDVVQTQLMRLLQGYFFLEKNELMIILIIIKCKTLN